MESYLSKNTSRIYGVTLSHILEVCGSLQVQWVEKEDKILPWETEGVGRRRRREGGEGKMSKILSRGKSYLQLE